MNKFIAGLVGIGIGVAAATAAMYFTKKDDDMDFWDDYEDDSSILLDSQEILTPFHSDDKAQGAKKPATPDVDNHQNDLL